jgi:predicted metal-dependent peptidase
MEFKQKDDIPTLMTDGKRIFYNKEFCDGLSVGLCAFVIAHEVSHPFLKHLDRPFKVNPNDQRTWGRTKEGKTWHYHPEVWNAAGDYVINLMLKDAGFQLWTKCLLDVQYKAMTTEKVYDAIMPKNPPPPEGGKGGKGDKCDTCGGRGDVPITTEPGEIEKCPDCEGSGQQAGGYDPIPGCDPITGRDIDFSGPAEDFSPQEFTEIVAKAATIAKAQGKLPGNVTELIKEATEPQYPVYHLLERFVDTSCKDEDQSWKRPHRDFMSRGIIMPSAYSDKVSHVVLVYDTSGSVPDADLMRFHRVGGDIIRRLKPMKLTVMMVDAKLHKVIEVTSDKDWPKTVGCTGRGGTSFKPAFEYLKEKQIKPSALVYMTDLEGPFPDPSNFPALWVSTVKENKAPFGMTIHFNG